jgi:hypothetical protein
MTIYDLEAEIAQLRARVIELSEANVQLVSLTKQLEAENDRLRLAAQKFSNALHYNNGEISDAQVDPEDWHNFDLTFGIAEEQLAAQALSAVESEKESE